MSDSEWNPPEHLPWMDDALCAQTDPEIFFPENGGSTRNAKRICGGCDVREECLQYALRTGQTVGVWAGLSPQQLRRQPGFVVQPKPRVDHVQIAALVAQGLDDQQVAMQVGCASKTVFLWRKANDIPPNSRGGAKMGKAA